MDRSEAESLLGYPVSGDWQFHEVIRNGERAGFIMSQGPEIHCHRLPRFSGRWLTRQDLERVVGPILKEYGQVTTMVRLENIPGHRFVTRLGFEKTGEHKANALYRATRLNHARL